MVWRLTENVVRGEINNILRNSTYGWIELSGCENGGVRLNLTGNLTGEFRGQHLRFEARHAADPPPPTDKPALDLNALETQQIGPTGEMSWRTGDQPRLYFEWFSQNGRMELELFDPLMEFVTHEAGSHPPAVEPDPIPGLDPTDEEVLAGDADDEETLDEDALDDTPDDDGDEDPYGLFNENLQETLSAETTSEAIAQIDGLGDDSTADRPRRSWEEVIPGIDDQTKKLYESWDEIFEGKKDVPLRTIFDPPLTLYPTDKLSDAEVEAALRVILGRLAMHSIALDICEHYTPRMAYKLLVEEILPESRIYPGLPLTGYVQHYSTFEYCQKCDEEFEIEWQAREQKRKESGEGDTGASDEGPF